MCPSPRPLNPFLNQFGHSSHGSINRVTLCDLPGFPLPSGRSGQQVYEVLSGPALAEAVQEDWALLAPPSRASVASMGSLLGHLIALLVTGPELARKARTEWGTKEWDWWAGIRRIHFGGGAFRGEVGRALVAAAEERLAQMEGGEAPTLVIEPEPERLSLRGAIRVAVGARDGLCFDWGQTNLKTAYFEPAGTVGFELYRSMPFPQWGDFQAGEERAQAECLHEVLVANLVEGIDRARQRSGRVPEAVGVSMANYVEGGLLSPRGAFGKLRLLADDYRSFLEAALQKMVGTRVPLVLVNDGVAASSAVPVSEEPSAILLWGTALGIGWPRAQAAVEDDEYRRGEDSGGV